MIQIPQGGQFRQTNKSDVLGNLQSTFNCDFTTNLGKTRVTRMIKTTDSNTNGGFSSFQSAPVAFKYFDTLLWFVNGTSSVNLYSNQLGTPSDPFGYNGYTIAGTSTKADMELFNGNLYITGSNTLNKKVSNGVGTGGITPNATTLSSNSNTHMMCVFQSRLYITDSGSKVISMDTTDTIVTTGNYTLNLADTNSNIITFIKAASNRIWVGTINTNLGGKGTIYEWDGTTANPTKAYLLQSVGALACVIKDDVPWVMDANGKLLQFTGSTFSEAARLPIDNKKYLGNATSKLNDRYIHPNGMTLSDGRINILINNVIGNNAASIPEFLPSGIWEYDDIVYDQYTGTSLGVGLYHKYSLSYLPVGTNTITDYGQNRISVAGALTDTKIYDTTAGATGTLLAGALIYTNASTTLPAIFTNDTFDAVTGTVGQINTKGYGYFVTTKIFAIDEQGNPSIQNWWNELDIMYRKFLSPTSKLTAKYRTADSDAVDMTITWTSTTTFTTATNILGKENYEVEITQGTGSGMTSHITKIDVTNGLYTVTVDEVYTGATGTAKARVQNWRKIASVTQNNQAFDQANIGEPSNWIQFKVCMFFTLKDELERLIIINKNYQPAN